MLFMPCQKYIIIFASVNHGLSSKAIKFQQRRKFQKAYMQVYLFGVHGDEIIIGIYKSK